MGGTIRIGLGAVVAVLAATALTATATPGPADAGTGSCGKRGYAYAGFQSASRAHGVRVTLRALADPAVENGHVGAWVGLGGPGQGPGGSDAWIQAGLSGFSWERASKLYYEVNRPGAGPAYKEVVARVTPGRRYRIAVLETARRDWWRVWVNGRPVSPPIHLRGSSGRWRPIATAETWDGGRRACNRFAYGFEHVEVASRRGGGWQTFRSGHRFLDAGVRLLASRGGTFLARTTLLPPQAPQAPQAPQSAPRAPVPVSAPPVARVPPTEEQAATAERAPEPVDVPQRVAETPPSQ